MVVAWCTWIKREPPPPTRKKFQNIFLKKIQILKFATAYSVPSAGGRWGWEQFGHEPSSILLVSKRFQRGSGRVLLTTWVQTEYCWAQGRIAPPSLEQGRRREIISNGGKTHFLLNVFGFTIPPPYHVHSSPPSELPPCLPGKSQFFFVRKPSLVPLYRGPYTGSRTAEQVLPHSDQNLSGLCVRGPSQTCNIRFSSDCCYISP